MEKKYYVIGLGGYGSKLAEELSLKMKKDGSSVVSIAFDTDRYEIENSECDYKFDLSAQGNFDLVVSNLLKKKNIKLFSDFDSIELNYARCLNMDKGSSLWRLKAYVCFVNYLCDENNKKHLDSLIEEIAYNPSVESEIYFVGSLAGGTSSALAVLLPLYLKKLFREFDYKKYKTLFFASTPDIFAISLNAELKTKAYANVYATLSEINTINLVTNKRESKNFIIGSKKMPFGELFNGTSGEYNYKACAPFSDVVLFDRMASVTSVDNFRLTVCSYIYHYYLGIVELEKNKSFDDMGIYSSYCVSELNYSLDDNVNYVSKYVTNKKINEEFIKAYKMFKDTEKGNYFINSANPNVTKTEKFTNAVILQVENLYDEKLDKPSLLLSRSENYDFGEDITSTDEATKYYTLIRNYFNNLINENEEFSKINNKLNNLYFTKDKNNKINFNNKGKKQKLKEFTDYYKGAYNQIKTLLGDLIENYFNNSEIEKLIFENNELLIENVIKIDGKYIHPTLALIKLSQVYNLFCQRQKAYLKLSETEIYRSIINNETPIKIFSSKGLTTTKKGYGSLPELRLVKTFDEIIFENDDEINENKKIKNIYTVKNPKREEIYIVSDLKLALENCSDLIFGIFISKILKSVENLIENYCKLYESAHLISSKLNNELSDLLSFEAEQSVYFNARSSKTSRFNDVNDYLIETSNKDYVEIDDNYGKVVFEFVKDLQEIGNDVKGITENLFTCERERFYQSETYSNLFCKNVLSATSEPNVNEYSKSLIKRVCSIKPYFITSNRPEEIEDRTLYISSGVASYVLENSDKFLLRETDPVKAVEELLSSMGDFDTRVKINDTLSNNKMFVVAKKCAVNLDSIIKLNSEDGSALYKVEYQKAIKNKSECYSEMWNPHIFLLDGKTKLSNI